MSFPVNAEIWNLFQSSLLSHAKKLTDDIAKKQGANPKELWDKIRTQIKIPLVDLEIPEEESMTCLFYKGTLDGHVNVRCMTPCLLGFDKCPAHIHKQSKEPISGKPVYRIIDCNENQYFVDENGIVMNKMLEPKGILEDGVLKLFEIKEE